MIDQYKKPFFVALFIGLCILSLFVLVTNVCNAQPEGLGNLADGNWTEDSNPVQLWVTPDGDSAWVHQGNMGTYWRAKVAESSSWYFHHPSMNGSYESLSQLYTDLDSIESGITFLIENGQIPDTQEQEIINRLQQIRDYKTSLDSLLSTIPGTDPSFTYSEDCQTNVDNATVYGGGTFALPTGQLVQEDDTIAAVSQRNNCVGYGIIKPQGFVLAVAGNINIEGVPDYPGVNSGETFTFELYDASEEKAYNVSPEFVSCSEIDVPICRESGYEDGSYFEVDSFVASNQ